MCTDRYIFGSVQSAERSSMEKQVNILGTEYRIEMHKVSDDETLKKNNWCGYCDEDTHLIVVADLDETEYFQYENEVQKDISIKETLRHEIVHAFFNESGLKNSSLQYTGAWSKNEEMVDWIAIQFPKIAKVYDELGIME